MFRCNVETMGKGEKRGKGLVFKEGFIGSRHEAHKEKDTRLEFVSFVAGGVSSPGPGLTRGRVWRTPGSGPLT